MQQQHVHRINKTGLPADVPDFKSALLNTDIGQCNIQKNDKYRPTSSLDTGSVNHYRQCEKIGDAAMYTAAQKFGISKILMFLRESLRCIYSTNNTEKTYCEILLQFLILVSYFNIL